MKNLKPSRKMKALPTNHITPNEVLEAMGGKKLKYHMGVPYYEEYEVNPDAGGEVCWVKVTTQKGKSGYAWYYKNSITKIGVR